MEYRIKKCEICGSSANVQVIASHFGSYSYASCPRCAYLGLEPYLNVVAFKFTVGIDTPIQDKYEPIDKVEVEQSGVMPIWSIG